MTQIKQNTPEWLALRKTHIGASDAPIIMGESVYKLNDGRWKTPFTLWQEKLELLPEQTPSRAMEYGLSEEEVTRRNVSRQLGIEFTPQVVFQPRS